MSLVESTPYHFSPLSDHIYLAYKYVFTRGDKKDLVIHLIITDSTVPGHK